MLRHGPPAARAPPPLRASSRARSDPGGCFVVRIQIAAASEGPRRSSIDARELVDVLAGLEHEQLLAVLVARYELEAVVRRLGGDELLRRIEIDLALGDALPLAGIELRDVAVAGHLDA